MVHMPIYIQLTSSLNYTGSFKNWHPNMSKLSVHTTSIPSCLSVDTESVGNGPTSTDKDHNI